MMTDSLVVLHGDVLGGMQRAPKPFAKLAEAHADDVAEADLDFSVFRAYLLAEDEALLSLWRRALTAWDFAEQATWSDAPPRSDLRREDAYERLGFSGDLRAALTRLVPVSREPGAVVISKQFTPWYAQDVAAARSFYWSAYEKYLRETKGWSESAIASLDRASRMVVERLTNPEQVEAYSSRGLVVGYVQSGKTANFTGVAAKAIDAGYRLVIILGGTLNLLRSQTQRRIDMELVGRENILRDADPNDLGTLVGIDYQDDDDWPEQFVTHGARPSALGAFDIERMTTRSLDYRSLGQGIKVLQVERQHPSLPLYAPQNLHQSAARVMVVKKNKSVLENLLQDLKKTGALLKDVPVLIIDDESDQASVNTTNPNSTKTAKADRTAINQRITQLLELMPRAQYVGYTATPFANVFIDPGDTKDIFPRDFLVSLPRPEGYMGVQDFHDLDSDIPHEERTFANSQEKAHVRDVGSDVDERLQEGIDAFVLAGALKLYRIEHGSPEGPYRHHTMLVHESVRTIEHEELAERIRQMWMGAGYAGRSGHDRLAALFAADFQPVSLVRANGQPMPGSYQQLRSFVSRACQLIGQGGGPVIVVNGATDSDFKKIDLDFDRTPNVWKILVGGTKLSRGFTVEGLTVTYYRRVAKQGDTLMQMGRWFGFRPGYQDLVRLYIGREEPLSRNRTIDLYEAFEAVCLDEEAFRSQLARYAELVDGKPQVTPAQVPPLVSQHLALVRPTARNKMFNADLEEIRSPGQPIEPAAYPTDSDALARNTGHWSPLLHSFTAPEQTFGSPQGQGASGATFTAATSVVTHAQLLGVLSHLEWAKDHHFRPHLNYLAQLDGTLATVRDWKIIAPILKGDQAAARILGQGPCPLVRRKRQPDKAAFSRIAGMEHRRYAEQLIADEAEGPERGVVLLYAVVEAASDAELRDAAKSGDIAAGNVILAFCLIPPKSANDATRKLVRFRAKDSSQEEAAIIDAPGTGPAAL